MATALFAVFGVALVAICAWTIFRGPAWFWALKSWVRIVLMASLGLIGSLGVWRAAVEAERVEPVWLEAPGVVPWRSLPIRVRMAADLDTYAVAASTAMRMWNEQVGCQLFKEVPPESMSYEVRILFLEGQPCEGVTPVPDHKVAASVYFCQMGGVDISVERLDEMQAAYAVFAHELGHVLGLAHDPSGLMAPRTEAMTLVLPSDKDIAAVRERYCLGAGVRL